jgi:hypothetical protein
MMMLGRPLTPTALLHPPPPPQEPPPLSPRRRPPALCSRSCQSGRHACCRGQRGARRARCTKVCRRPARVVTPFCMLCPIRSHLTDPPAALAVDPVLSPRRRGVVLRRARKLG